MKKIWLIETGCYSDYRVFGVFSTRQKAIGVANTLKLGEDSVQEWIIDPGVEELSKGYWKYHVIMLQNGKVESIEREEKLYDFDVSHFIWDRPNTPAFKGKNIPAALNANVWAKNEKHAVKIVNEIRSQMIANNEWTAS